MAWTAPTTRATGNLITASIWNTDIVDNLDALKAPPTDTAEVTSGYTTTSTSFVNVDGTNLSLSITTTGGDLLVHFHGAGDNLTTATFTYFDFTVNGTRQGSADGITYFGRDATNDQYPVSFSRLVTGLAAGTYTINLQWRTTGGTARLNNEGSSIQFWARETS